MLKKRRMLLSLGAASLVTGRSGSSVAPRRARPTADLLLVGRRAQRSREERDARPLRQNASGIEIAHASPTNYAKIKAMVEAGQPEWDLVDVGGRFIDQGKDLLETLDMSLIPNAKTLDPGWVAPKGIFTSTGATVIAWNTKAFPRTRRPPRGRISGTSRPFPGRAGSTSRFYYNYEAALLAAGDAAIRRSIPVTDDKVKLAIRQAARDQAACEGVVDRRRAAAAAPLER